MTHKNDCVLSVAELARVEGEGTLHIRAVEADLRSFTQAQLDLDGAELTRQCEQAIRNYDPAYPGRLISWI